MTFREDLANLATLKERAMKPLEGYKYQSMEACVLSEGHNGNRKPFTEKELEMIGVLIQNTGTYFKQRECFANAYMLSQAAQRIGLPIYHTEGLALSLFGVNHAWVELNSKPIDVTWGAPKSNPRGSADHVMKRIIKNQAEKEYIGFQVPTAPIEKLMFQNGVYPSVLDDWQNDWPLLRDGVPKSWGSNT